MRLIITAVVTLAATLLFAYDVTRPVHRDTKAYRLGITEGELIGHNHSENGVALTPEAAMTASAADLPWSVKLAPLHAINEYRAGWVVGYKRGVYHRTPERAAE